MHTPVKLNVITDQHDKLKYAVTYQKAASIKLNLEDNSGDGSHTLFLTRGQIAKFERAKLIGKRNVSIHLSKRQVQANVKHQGGFFGMLAGLAAKALPRLLKGLASGLVSSAVKKVVGGDGLYLHKSGHCVKVEPVKGDGLYLTPHKRLSGVHDDGLYLKRGSTNSRRIGIDIRTEHSI